MTTVSKVLRLVAGIARQIDLSSSGNALWVDSLQVGATSPSTLTKAILDNLIALQNGTDFASGTNSHTHDGRYYTETELTDRTATSGATLIAVERKTYANITGYASLIADTLANYNIQKLLDGVNTSLAAAAGSSFSDTMFEIYDDGDITKKIKFQASGVATATTRTITMPDSNVDLGKIDTAIQRAGTVAFTANQPMGGFKLTGLSAGTTAGDSVRYEQAVLTSGVNAFTAAQSMGGFKLTNVADPTAAQDAATKAYVDATSLGLKPKAAVRVATLVAGTLATDFENGDTVDGIVLATGNRILIKNQASAATNGIYTVNASGAPTRATDFDSLSPIDEINGSYTFVQEGTQAGQGWVQTGTVTTLGTDAINFVYFNDVSTAIGGDMITKTGNTFSVDLAAISGLESSTGTDAGQLRTKLEAANPTLKITGSNELAAKLNTGATTGNITTSATGLKADTDGATLETAANVLQVKDLGITTAKLATNAVTTVKITDANVTLAKLATGSVDENKLTASVAGAGLTGGAGAALAVGAGDASITVTADAVAVARDAAGAIGLSGTGIKANVDGTSIEISANALAVKETGILKVFTTLTNNTGGTVAAGTVVALSLSTAGELILAKADALATSEGVVGVVFASIANAASGKVQVVGRATPTQDAVFDLGKRVYVSSATAGSSTKTAPTATNSVVFLLGHAVTTTEVILNTQLIALNE